MTDIALIWDPVNGRADFAVAGGDLVMDQGLATAVIISLFCDGLADPGDAIPDGTLDRRGWWGDTPLPNATDPTAGGIDLTGSKLWLLARALQTQETLNQAQSYAQAALAWMITDGIAGSIDATAVFPATPPNALELSIDIYQTGAANPTRFAFAWSAS
ncbi:phage GP46 family protein [Rhodopila sp.]|uniref:phage GP46 family protein n=1 Tax=Rhodopila sp. TaxID=2480087 RepID=UPI003D0F1D1F